MYKYILIIAFSILAFAPAQAQEFRKAKSVEEYTSMFKNKSIPMVRSHKDFIMHLNKNKSLKSKFKGEVLKEFLMDLRFSRDGLMGFRIPQGIKMADPDSFLLEVSGIFSIGPPMVKDTKGAYCKPPCTSDKVSICITKNCKEGSTLKGGDFDANNVIKYYN